MSNAEFLRHNFAIIAPCLIAAFAFAGWSKRSGPLPGEGPEFAKIAGRLTPVLVFIAAAWVLIALFVPSSNSTGP